MNKKGLSTIVITLILIALALIGSFLIWLIFVNHEPTYYITLSKCHTTGAYCRIDTVMLEKVPCYDYYGDLIGNLSCEKYLGNRTEIYPIDLEDNSIFDPRGMVIAVNVINPENWCSENKGIFEIRQVCEPKEVDEIRWYKEGWNGHYEAISKEDLKTSWIDENCYISKVCRKEKCISEEEGYSYLDLSRMILNIEEYSVSKYSCPGNYTVEVLK